MHVLATYGKNNVILFSIRNIEINLTVGDDFYLMQKKIQSKGFELPWI